MANRFPPCETQASAAQGLDCKDQAKQTATSDAETLSPLDGVLLPEAAVAISAFVSSSAPAVFTFACMALLSSKVLLLLQAVSAKLQ